MATLGIPARLAEQINVAPTEAIPVVFEEDGQRRMRLMRWWLTPSWAPEISQRYSMFNARAETVASSPAFRGPLRHRRCVIPASAFIEWVKRDGVKQPLLIQAEQRALAFAGLWDVWEKDNHYLESCTIITTAAVPGFAHIHGRQPVMLDESDLATWLDVRIPPRQLAGLLAPQLVHALTVQPLSPRVSNARNKNPADIVPFGEVERIAPEFPDTDNVASS